MQALLLSHPVKLIRDTARFPPLMRPAQPGRKPKPRALRHLAFEELGLGIQEGEHSPVEDARSALYLYQRHAKVKIAPYSVFGCTSAMQAKLRIVISEVCNLTLKSKLVLSKT